MYTVFGGFVMTNKRILLMANHLLLPIIRLDSGLVSPEYETYVNEWLTTAYKMIDEGKVSSSICLQGSFLELSINGRLTTDWLGIIEEYLMDGDRPLAYSENYSRLLHKFNAQYKQSTIHAIHTKWWLDNQLNSEKIDHQKYASMIFKKSNLMV
jgi:hypothetical protein